MIKVYLTKFKHILPENQAWIRTLQWIQLRSSRYIIYFKYIHVNLNTLPEHQALMQILDTAKIKYIYIPE